MANEPHTQLTPDEVERLAILAYKTGNHAERYPGIPWEEDFWKEISLGSQEFYRRIVRAVAEEILNGRANTITTF